MDIREVMLDLASSLLEYADSEVETGEGLHAGEMKGFFTGRASAFRQASDFITDRVRLHNSFESKGGK